MNLVGPYTVTEQELVLHTFAPDGLEVFLVSAE